MKQTFFYLNIVFISLTASLCFAPQPKKKRKYKKQEYRAISQIEQESESLITQEGVYSRGCWDKVKKGAVYCWSKVCNSSATGFCNRVFCPKKYQKALLPELVETLTHVQRDANHWKRAFALKEEEYRVLQAFSDKLQEQNAQYAEENRRLHVSIRAEALDSELLAKQEQSDSKFRSIDVRRLQKERDDLLTDIQAQQALLCTLKKELAHRVHQSPDALVHSELKTNIIRELLEQGWKCPYKDNDYSVWSPEHRALLSDVDNEVSHLDLGPPALAEQDVASCSGESKK